MHHSTVSSQTPLALKWVSHSNNNKVCPQARGGSRASGFKMEAAVCVPTVIAGVSNGHGAKSTPLKKSLIRALSSVCFLILQRD